VPGQSISLWMLADGGVPMLARSRRILLTIILLAVLSVPQEGATAAVSASPRWTASTFDATVPYQTITYAITVVRTSKLSHLDVTLPAASSRRYTHYSTNTHVGKLSNTVGGYRFRIITPYALSSGARVKFRARFTTPAAGSYRVKINLVDTNGRSMGSGYTPPATFKQLPVCRAAWTPDDITAERNMPGSASWRLTRPFNSSALAAYADRGSATCGDTVTLRVHTVDPIVSVEAFRSEYYGGVGARRVWSGTTSVLAWRQPPPLFVRTDSVGRTINMPTAKNWTASVSLKVDGRYAPGQYLIKITSAHYQTYVPLTVRDTGPHKYLVLSSVSTWQTYNAFGGYSGYSSPASSRISYDRPFLRNQGTGQYLSEEMGFIWWASKQNLDIQPAADVDLHTMPMLLSQSKVLVLLSHSEYWSPKTRASVDSARAAGLKILNLGANQGYWRIKPVSSTVTGVSREHEIFRTGETARFRDPPDPHPEQLLLGSMYGCVGADGTTTPSGGWLWQGVAPTPLPHLPFREVDQVRQDFPQAPGTTVLTSTKLSACGHEDPSEWVADIVSVDDGLQGRVVSMSTLGWVCALIASCPWGYSVSPEMAIAVGQATLNATSWLDTGASPAAQVTETRLERYRGQRVGWVSPTTGMPHLDPEDEK
jgi:hypothetical protein